MNFFVQIMMPALDFFYELTRNYGLAIVVLTLVIKAAFWSLTNKQYQSMAAMKNIQPKIKELQKKHKDNPQKMQQETLKLYQEHGVNPFGGCLPMLIQLPFLIALFATLNSAEFVAKSADKAFLWIRNISFTETMNFTEVIADTAHAQHGVVAQLGLQGINSYLVVGGFALPVLAVLVAISTYLSQKTMDVDPSQQKTMMFMPVILFFLSYNLNSGVLIYWVVSNLVTAFQQSYIKTHKVREQVATIEIEHVVENGKKSSQAKKKGSTAKKSAKKKK